MHGLQEGCAVGNPEKRGNESGIGQKPLAGDQANLIGCSLTAHIKVPDAGESMKKLCEFGSHLSMVYGDYTREVHELADMLDLEVVRPT